MRKSSLVGVVVLALTALGCEENDVDCSTLSMEDCAEHSACQVIKAQQMDLERGCQQQTPVPMVCQRADLLCPAVVGILRGPDSKCWVFNMCGPERDSGWTDDCDVTGYPPPCAAP